MNRSDRPTKDHDPRFIHAERNRQIIDKICNDQGDHPAQAALAREFGISRQRVNQIVQRHRARQKRALMTTSSFTDNIDTGQRLRRGQ